MPSLHAARPARWRTKPLAEHRFPWGGVPLTQQHGDSETRKGCYGSRCCAVWQSEYLPPELYGLKLGLREPSGLQHWLVLLIAELRRADIFENIGAPVRVQLVRLARTCAQASHGGGLVGQTYCGGACVVSVRLRRQCLLSVSNFQTR